MTRIGLISDLHTGEPDDSPFDIDLRANFRSVLSELMNHQPDHLIIAGDLCLKDGDKAIYRWQKSKFDALDVPYSIIAGNHDDAGALYEVFSHLPRLHDGELYYHREMGGYHFIFLDTAKGCLSSMQKKWFEEKLVEKLDLPKIVIMHHPPDKMHVPHMDSSHALRDAQQVMEILRGHQHPLQIFCGHYHVEKSVSFGNVHIHITPSCYFQIDPFSEEFRIDHKDIAYRLIDLYPDHIDHHVRYLKGHATSNH